MLGPYRVYVEPACMQNACMTTVTIRDVPPEIHRELVARASQAGQSLQEYLRAWLVKEADRPDMYLLMKRIRERVADSEISVTNEQILEDLDAIRG